MKEVPIWFPGARLNYAENVLRHNTDAIAITAARATGQIAHYTFRDIRRRVEKLAAAMRVNGLQVGDRVAGESTCRFCIACFSLRCSYRDKFHRCYRYCTRDCQYWRDILQHCHRYGSAGM